MPLPTCILRRAIQVRGASIVPLIAGLHLGVARAEDSISAKYQDYRESDGRIAVRVSGVAIEKVFGESTTLKASAVLDAIAGATPDGRPPAEPGGSVPLSHLEEERRAWTFELGRQLGQWTLAVGIAQSRESDYHSTGASLNAALNLNQKNTTLLFGVAATEDKVKSPLQLPWEDKRSLDLLVGITQLLNPLTSVTINLSFGEASGYLSDPYKLIQKNTEVVPGFFLPLTYAENRPRSRKKWLGLAAVNRAFPRLNGAIDASLRFHSDDFGSSSQMLQVEWFQKIGQTLTLRPFVRLFQQDAADFYYVSLDNTSIVPSRTPRGAGPHYSADYRLSALQSTAFGIKIVWMLKDSLQLDASLERYAMHGRDDVTSSSAYPSASIVTVGAKYVF
ncbi:MAG TPA: DUF3570 domain-containing protein [Opitutaceae bacterium]|nr:DUF3570 domain-containing protein [Opitutaceae bacterium]